MIGSKEMRPWSWSDGLNQKNLADAAILGAQQMGGRLGAMMSPGYNPENMGPMMPDGGPVPGKRKRMPATGRSWG